MSNIDTTDLVNPLDLDTLIFDYMVNAGITWADLVKIHDSKRGAKEIYLDDIPLGIKEVLQYIRSITRILIQYNINTHKKTNKDFRSIIAGSTNITSDYDVSFVGEGSALLCNKIIKSFKKHTRGDLTDIADSNIYITPAYIIKKGVQYPSWLDNIIIRKNEAIPFPKTRVSIKKEIEAVFKRDGYKETRHITDKYDDMVTHGKKLEDLFYYPTNGKFYDNEEEFWELLHQTNFDSVEGYITSCAVAVVVVEMQMKMMFKKITPIHYLISAFENLINFIVHNHGKTVTNDIRLLKTSKYIYRTVYSLKKSNMREKLKEIDIDNIKYIVSNRGNPNASLYKSAEFRKFKKDTLNIIGLKEDIKKSLKTYLSSIEDNHKKDKQGKRKTRKIRRKRVKNQTK